MKDKILAQAVTFDDVLVVPAHSDIVPSEVRLDTYLTKNIKLSVPIMSAAMDTVTEADLAIAMAHEGGIGIIHKNMPIADQVAQVKRVKRKENGIISSPITLKKDDLLSTCQAVMDENSISGIPIVDNNKTLIGIITRRDMKYVSDLTKSIDSILRKDLTLITAPKGTSLEQAKEIMFKSRIEKLPIIDENNKLVGLITMKDLDNLSNHPFATKDSYGRLRVGAAIGTAPDLMDRVKSLVDANVDVLVFDSAHGHSIKVIESIREIRKVYPDIDLIAGNIVTPTAALELKDAGVDAVKVGIGSGSICTTRIVAGVGMPQVTAIINVSEALKDTDVKVIADGGINSSGDIVKAIVSGADVVMLGRLLAGTDEAPGDNILVEGRMFKSYMGMGSLAAMQRGGSERYFQKSNQKPEKLVPEGIEGMIPYQGKIENVLFQLCGGLRAGMGYAGAKDLTALKTAQFVSITNSGLIESHPHDVRITNEAPNYQQRD